MKIFPIASSSSGNCTVIECGDSVVLIDCGVTLKKIKAAVVDLNRIKAVFITHEHSDHVGGVGPLSRKVDCPFYVNEASVKKKEKVFADCKTIKNLESGNNIAIDNLINILAFTTKHDAAYSVGFVINQVGKENKKLGYVTDTGFITPMMTSFLSECSALFIEADYDDTMMDEYELYDEFLKDRIKSNFGHLSNAQMIEFIETSINLADMDFVIVGHLSGRTNSPERVRELIDKNFKEHSNKFHIAPLEREVLWKL